MGKPFIGQKDRKIEVIELVKTRDALMAEVTTETENVISTPWAYMQESGGGELEQGKILHLVDRSYTIRYNAIVREKSNQLVVVDRGKRYQVIHVIEIGRKDHLEIRVKLYE